MSRATDLGNRWGLSPHAASHLAALEAVVGELQVTSGRRSPERNKAVGGVEDSLHLVGRAVDVVPSNGLQAFAVMLHAPAQRITARCTGPEEVIDEGDHIHLAW